MGKARIVSFRDHLLPSRGRRNSAVLAPRESGYTLNQKFTGTILPNLSAKGSFSKLREAAFESKGFGYPKTLRFLAKNSKHLASRYAYNVKQYLLLCLALEIRLYAGSKSFG